MLIQTLRGLSFMQDGLLMCHRDIKPENIMFNENFEVLIVDFGLSKVIREEFKTEYEGE